MLALIGADGQSRNYLALEISQASSLDIVGSKLCSSEETSYLQDLTGKFPGYFWLMCPKHVRKGCSKSSLQQQQQQQHSMQISEKSQRDHRRKSMITSASSSSNSSAGHPLLSYPQQMTAQHRQRWRTTGHGNNTARSSSPNSNSSSDASGRRQLKRTMLDPREDVDDVQEQLQSLRLHTLWLMSQEVRRERQEAARQLTIQGLDTRAESSNHVQAARQRDHYIAELLERLLRRPAASIQHTSAHSTSLREKKRRRQSRRQNWQSKEGRASYPD